MAEFKRITVPRKVEIGCQIYVNKYDTPERIRYWVRKIKEANLSIMRVFLFRDIINPSENEWYWEPFDALFDEGERLGVKVCAVLWAVNPPGWMNITQSFNDFGDLDDPVFWEDSLQMVRKVVERYHNSPALDSWIGWKEAERVIGRHPNSLRSFREFLKETYGTVENFNRIYFNSIASFEEYGLKDSYCQHEFKPYADTLDWNRFAVWNLCGKLRELSDTIRSIDQVHPIHVNGHGLASNKLWCGQSLFQEAKAVDFTGLSSHTFYGGERFPHDRFHQHDAYNVDLARSASLAENGMFWVTEGTGGPAVMSSTSTHWSLDGDDMRHLVWEDLGSGATKCLYWQISTRNSGHEAGEQSLCALDETPTPRLNALTEAAGLIRQNQDLFDRAACRRPDVWLLVSERTWELCQFEARDNDKRNPRNTSYGPDATAGAYMMLADLGLNVQLCDEERVIRDKLPQDAVLIAPTAVAAEDGLIDGLERFVLGGGTLIADHLIGFKDKYGRIPEPAKARHILDRMFGARLHDVFSTHDALPFQGNGHHPTGWFFRLLFQEDLGGLGGRAVARWDEDGSPAVIANDYGQGHTVRIGTCFFQHYFAEPCGTNLGYLKSILPERVFAVTKLLNPSTQLRLRELVAADKSIVILLNTDKKHDTVALLKTDADKTLTPLAGGDSLPVKAGEPLGIPMARGQVRQYILE